MVLASEAALMTSWLRRGSCLQPAFFDFKFSVIRSITNSLASLVVNTESAVCHRQHNIFAMLAPTRKKTILFFGDQTDEWLDHINYIARQAVSTPWLQSFMEDVCGTVKSETRGMESTMTESLGEYASLYELAERYTHITDEAGLANAILIYTMRAAMLLK